MNKTKEVQYVGRTNNPICRQKEHGRDPKKTHLDPLEVKFTGLTRIEAQVMEQIVISTYITQTSHLNNCLCTLKIQ